MFRAIILFILFLLPIFVEAGCVLVTVAPHRFFVERIAGDTVEIGLIVPAGDSGHTYEPTPKQMMEACKADIWFQIGEPFEIRASRAMRERNPTLRLVDLRNGVAMIQEHSCAHCKNSADPHIWLSARQAKVQATTIAKTLSEVYPANAEKYKANLEKFIAELTALDEEILKMYNAESPKFIVVGHPAYGYFVRDYGQKQVSVESEGRDPSPKQLTNLLNQIKSLNVQKIYVQPQYSTKGPTLIANQLGIKVVELNPYSEDYINSMRSIGQNFSRP